MVRPGVAVVATYEQHPAIQQKLTSDFDDLADRSQGHRWVLGVVVLIAVVGAGAATIALLMLPP